MGYAEMYGRDVFHNVLDHDFPSIPWRTPISVEAPGIQKFGCRYCICAFGLGADQLRTTDFVFDNADDCESHLAEKHPAVDTDYPSPDIPRSH